MDHQTPFLTTNTALILLIALVMGATVGTLTFLSADVLPAAVLAGLTATGASIPVLRSSIA
ncbi:hypothetical protein [Streptomyces sp. NBC_01568]|uniref:hypothetical protein n=1 Tax=Streptomyces sp. NBC_01568 TaxID=2975882 RepID=UPI00386B3BB0